MSNIEKHNNQGLQIASLDEAMRYAEAMSQAGMIPEKFKGQPANVLVATEIANDLSESTWMVMSELHFVGSVPTFSAKFMRSRVRQAGHKLRESYDKATGTARAVIIRHDDPEFEHVAEWDEAKARDHGLWGKNHWKKNPELMLKNRALSEVLREACYEVMGGIAYTTDEAHDFVRMESQRMDQRPQQRQEAPQQPPQRPNGQQQGNSPQQQSNAQQQAQQAAPKPPPTMQEWAEKMERLERAGEIDKVEANVTWAHKRGHGDLFQAARGVYDRMVAAQQGQQAPQGGHQGTEAQQGSQAPQQGTPSPQQAQETAQQVLDAEIVTDEA